MKDNSLKEVNILDEALAERPGANENLDQVHRRAASDADLEDIVSFNVRMLKVLGEDPMPDERLRGTRPIMTDDGQVVGFFVMKTGGYAKIFLARDARPFGLFMSSGQEFYLTLRVSTDRKHPEGWISMVVSEVPLNANSVKVVA